MSAGDHSFCDWKRIHRLLLLPMLLPHCLLRHKKTCWAHPLSSSEAV
jgi:hypothetical protein